MPSKQIETGVQLVLARAEATSGGDGAVVMVDDVWLDVSVAVVEL